MRHNFIFDFYSDTKELIELLDISVSQTDKELIKKYKKSPMPTKKHQIRSKRIET